VGIKQKGARGKLAALLSSYKPECGLVILISVENASYPVVEQPSLDCTVQISGQRRLDIDPRLEQVARSPFILLPNFVHN